MSMIGYKKEEEMKNTNEKALGIDNMVPDRSTNLSGIASGLNLTNFRKASGPRGQMFAASHIEQAIPLLNPETPRVFTGFESVYGKYTNSYLKADKDYRVIAVIQKNPSTMFEYLYVVQDISTFEYDIIDVKHHESLAQKIGYIRPLKYSNFKKVGDIIKKDEVIYKSNNHDEHFNYRYGVNMKAAFVAISETIQDGVVISESLANRVRFYEIDEVEFPIAKSDILLNTYGKLGEYKCFPDIGEKIVNNTICYKRKIKKTTAIPTLTKRALSKNISTDDIYTGSGSVLDIEVFVNDKEHLYMNEYNSQLIKYYENLYQYHEKITHILSAIVKNKSSKYTFKLLSQLRYSSDFINDDVKITNNKNSLEFAYIKFKTIKEFRLYTGNKVTNRFGGKGVIVAIWPDDKMPKDKYGNTAEILLSPASSIARAIPGQMFEQEINFIASGIQKTILPKLKSVKSKIETIQRFYDMISDEFSSKLKQEIKLMDDDELSTFVDTIEKDGFYIQQDPFGDDLTLPKLRDIYKEFKIYPNTLKFNVDISKNYDFETQRDIVIGDMYMMVLEQTPFSKYSVRSIGAVNSLGLPVKSKNPRIYPDKPVKFSELCLYNSLTWVKDPKEIYKLYETHSVDPKLRSDLVKQLATEDPLDLHDLDRSGDKESVITKQLKTYLYMFGVSIHDDK